MRPVDQSGALGAAQFYKGNVAKHLITVKTEHKATLDTMRELGVRASRSPYLDVQENGLIDMNAFQAAAPGHDSGVGDVRQQRKSASSSRSPRSPKSPAARASSSTSIVHRPPARSRLTCGR